MRSVRPFDGRLLQILQGLLGRRPLAPTVRLLKEPVPRPRGLSRAAVELIQDELSKGMILWLARSGGWERQRFLRDGRPVAGRLWERRPLPELTFHYSRFTIELLLTLATEEPDVARRTAVDQITLGDRLFLWRAYEVLRATPWGQQLRRWPVVATLGPLWLTTPEDFGTFTPHWQPWESPTGLAVLEAVQPWLAHQTCELEFRKAGIVAPLEMQRLGQGQAKGWATFETMLDQTGRRDLAGFLLTAATKLFTPASTAADWTRGLKARDLPLAARVEVGRSALAFAEQIVRLDQWTQRARQASFYDDDYPAWQFWLAEWERSDGPARLACARRLLQEIDPLATTAPPVALTGPWG